ncbi:P-loop containing nucleoside triphosphate hydrolase protein [Wallemia mellicola]|nr:P-loop containing nucleoside triphosphate hydrolase protein [Wallemia mellicola]TIB88954.1 P-loop containing nucleoside triphosphate hydrolase protein [Wallemia mellicola]TIC34854.1 P-loop containing nucleoside triphosphate hydrolase protein [Wallemia mellicola]TIC41055.1 P-loop containing nucleoside triphosphate hydrolase protein [Wallemia mellicola]TIC43825.1 P-loop containing nucleoside triphosphate hydrolase protein [Wallemia mellicola]
MNTADKSQQWRRSSPYQKEHQQSYVHFDGLRRTKKYIEDSYPNVHLKSHLTQNPKSPIANYVMLKYGFAPAYQNVACIVEGKLLYRSFVRVDQTQDRVIEGFGDNPVAKMAEQVAALDALYQLKAFDLLDSPERNFTSNEMQNSTEKTSTHFLSDNTTAIDFETSKQFVEFYCNKYNVSHKVDAHQRMVNSGRSKKKHSDGWTSILKIHGLTMGRADYPNKKQANQLAYIDATKYLHSCDNSLWQLFQDSIKEETNKKAERAAMDAFKGVSMSYHASNRVQETLNGVISNMKDSKIYSKRPYNEEDEDVITRSSTPLNAANNPSKQFKPRRPPAKKHLENKSKSMSKDLEFYNTNQQFDKIRQQRGSLPIFTQAEEVVTSINDNMITVLMAATGSGKTTQMPQLILDDAIQHGRGAKCNILCTQPRRIAAISVAQRVASERGEKLGKRVGYQVRFESKKPEPHGSITFCTTGVFLRRMQSALEESAGDSTEGKDKYGMLDDITHVVVDEVHERDVDTDLTLVVLKRLIADRKARGKPLKVILMSATIDSDLFQNYFASVNNDVPAPVADIPGRSFPVTKYFLDDYLEEMKTLPEKEGGWVFKEKNVMEYMKNEFKDEMGGDELEIPYPLVALTIAHVARLSRNEDGHILIFLPGWDEIKAVQTILEEQKLYGVDFNDRGKYSIHVLHSSVPVQEQQKIFEPCEEGIRRIILSTNVAETSVTIPDVVYVVDAARVKEKRYDAEKHMSQLVSAWVGKSNLNQRAGRAGRHREGEYYGVLSKRRYESLAAHQTVEMKRVDLSEVVLRVKALNFPGLEVEDVLAQAIEPPAPERVKLALDRLYLIGAINKKKELTSLGKVLLQLPIEAPIGKLILYATFFRCLDPALSLAAILTNRDPFVAPLDLRAEANAAKQKWSQREYKSDPFTILNAYETWWGLHSAGKHSQAWDFVNENFLSRATLLQIRQVKEHLYKSLESLKLTEFLTSDPALNKAKVGSQDKAKNLRKGELVIPDYLNVNAHSKPMLAALIAMSCSPNFALRTGDRNHRTAAEKSVFIHSSSVLHPRNEKDEVSYSKQLQYVNKHIVSFQEKTKNISNLSAGPPGREPQVMLRMCTKLDLMVYALFGAAEIKQDGDQVIIDDWVVLFGQKKELESLRKLKMMLHSCMLRVFEGVHAGSALEQAEMYNDEEIYKLDNLLVLQSEEEAEQVNEEKLSPKEQVELDLMANNVVFLLNQWAKDANDYEDKVFGRKQINVTKKGNGAVNKKYASNPSSGTTTPNNQVKAILKRPASQTGSNSSAYGSNQSIHANQSSQSVPAGVLADANTPSMPTSNMLRANSAILAELMSKGEADNGELNKKVVKDVSGSGTCTVVSSSRSPTPKLDEEPQDEVQENVAEGNISSGASSVTTPKESVATPRASNVATPVASPQPIKANPVPSLVVVPPRDTSKTSVRREREERTNHDENDNDNGWKYIATNKARKSQPPPEEDPVAMDFGPSMPLDERFNFISLTEPNAISKLEPKLNESGISGNIPDQQQTKPGSHKSRVSTSDSIALSQADSTKSTFKSSMGRIFKGKKIFGKRRKTLEGVQSPAIEVPPLPTSFSQTLPALRSIEPMNINLPTAEEIERREEEARQLKEAEERRKKEREEEQARNRKIQENRIRELKEAGRSKSSLGASKVSPKAAPKEKPKEVPKNTTPAPAPATPEPEFTIEDADWATAVINQYN